MNTPKILYNSWGYDQTNINFFQVLSETAKTYIVREIHKTNVPGSGGFLSATCLAVPGDFYIPQGEWDTRGREYRVLKPKSGSNYCHGSVGHSDTQLLGEWDGQPLDYSWGH